jgi:hypothetical protein
MNDAEIKKRATKATLATLFGGVWSLRAGR